MRRARILTLAATALGSAVAFLDTTVVIVALPRMEDDLALGLAGQQWVVLGYGLALSALFLPSGAVGDRVGLRATFAVGVGLFAAASVACAAAPTEGWLVAGRVLQGVGGAALTTTSLALLRVVWSGSEGRAIGLWTSLTSVATVVGPALGGVIVEVASWRWIFLLNVPVAAAVIALALAGSAEGERRAGRSTIDVPGAALAATALTGLSFALVEAADRGIGTVAPAFLGGVLALGGLVAWTLRAQDPLVPPRLLRRPGLAAANVVTFALYGAFAAHLLLVPVYLQFLGFTAVVAGLAFSLPSLALVLLAPALGRVADRIGPRRPVALGSLAVALSLLLLLPVEDRASAWLWATVSLALFSIGLAAVVSPITAAALAPAPEELAGIASGLNQTVARAGGVLSIAAVGALAGWAFARSGGSGDAPFDPDLVGPGREAGIDAFRAAVLAIAVIAFVAAGLAASILRDRRPAAATGTARS